MLQILLYLRVQIQFSVVFTWFNEEASIFGYIFTTHSFQGTFPGDGDSEVRLLSLYVEVVNVLNSEQKRYSFS